MRTNLIERLRGMAQLVHAHDAEITREAISEIEQLRGDLMAEIHTNDELRAVPVDLENRIFYRLKRLEADAPIDIRAFAADVRTLLASPPPPAQADTSTMGKLRLLIAAANRIAYEAEEVEAPDGLSMAILMDYWTEFQDALDEAVDALSASQSTDTDQQPAQAAGGVVLDRSVAERIASMLEADATSLFESHTIGGRWEDGDPVKCDHDEIAGTANTLRVLLAQQQPEVGRG